MEQRIKVITKLIYQVPISKSLLNILVMPFFRLNWFSIIISSTWTTDFFFQTLKRQVSFCRFNTLLWIDRWLPYLPFLCQHEQRLPKAKTLLLLYWRVGRHRRECTYDFWIIGKSAVVIMITMTWPLSIFTLFTIKRY